MEFGQHIGIAALGSHFIVGLSRAMILFTVSAGLSFVLGVLRVPNIAHGSLFMIGAFTATSISVEGPGSLYQEDLASFTMGGTYDPKHSEGFVRLFGLPGTVERSVRARQASPESATTPAPESPVPVS